MLNSAQKHRLWVLVRTAEAVLTSTNNLCFEQKYEKYQSFLPENFHFFEVKFSIHLNRRVFVMSRIKWAGELSHPINIRQGVRQGGVLSTGHYKRYNNPLLLQLEERYTGFKIGSIGFPHITVADDLALLARDRAEKQVMVWDVENSSDRERYCIHPAKSHLLWYSPHKKKDTDFDIFLSDDKVDITDTLVHLGILRNTAGTVDIEGKIALGRKTAYSLMGAGFHGGSGLQATQNGDIWSAFVIPRPLYGLEVQLLRKKDIEH